MRLEPSDMEVFRPLIEQIVQQTIERLQPGGVPKVFTEDEAADILKLRKHQLRDERLRGRINCCKGPRGKVLYSVDHLRQYLERGGNG